MFTLVWQVFFKLIGEPGAGAPPPPHTHTHTSVDTYIIRLIHSIHIQSHLSTLAQVDPKIHICWYRFVNWLIVMTMFCCSVYVWPTVVRWNTPVSLIVLRKCARLKDSMVALTWPYIVDFRGKGYMAWLHILIAPCPTEQGGSGFLI